MDIRFPVGAVSLAATKLLTSSVYGARLMRYAATRFATIGDQLVVSLANFGLTLAIGRAYAAEELASYGIGLSIGLMLQGWHRHAVLIPLMLQPDRFVARRSRGIVGQQVIVLAATLIAGGALMGLAELADFSRYGRLVVGASVVCLFVYVQLEFARAILVKLDRAAALLASGAWYATVVVVLAAAALSHRIDYWMLLAALCAAMLLHMLAILALSGGFSLLQGLRLLAVDSRKYGGWAAVATATYAGYNHVPLMILGALAAPIHAAGFVATRSLMQPLQILLRGLDLADKSSFAKDAGAAHEASGLRLTLRLAALYACVAGLFGIGMAIFADEIMALAYGSKFAHLGLLLIAWIPVYILLSVTMPLESLVYARHEFRGYFQVRAVASILAIALAVPLVLNFAGMGAILACGIGGLVAVAGTIHLLLRKRKHDDR